MRASTWAAALRITAFMLLTNVPSLAVAQLVTTTIDFEDQKFRALPDFGDGFSQFVVVTTPEGATAVFENCRLLTNSALVPGNKTTVIGTRAGLKFGAGITLNIPAVAGLSFTLINAGPAEEFGVQYYDANLNVATLFTPVIPTNTSVSVAMPDGSGGLLVYPRFTRASFSYFIDNVTFKFRPAAKDKPGPHPGISPTRPENVGDTVVVVDHGVGLDTGCTFRDGGPLEIDLPVKRVVGSVDANGKLLNPALLTSAGHLSRTAKLTFAAWDVDEAAGEADRVYFNDHLLGTLRGANNAWALNSFTIPIELVRFGRVAQGIFNVEGINELKIEIDQGSGTIRNFCTSIDWLQLKFDATAPIFLIHGIAAQSDTWEGGSSPVVDYLRSVDVPFSHQIDLEANGSLEENGFLLSDRLGDRARAFGTTRCHIIAHSKGGNDIRRYLAKYHLPTSLRVLSLHTLSTPFLGSVIADVLDTARSQSIRRSPDADLQTLITEDLAQLSKLRVGAIPCCDGLESLRPDSMEDFNRITPFPPDVRFYNYAADADINDDQEISGAENQTYPNRFGIDGDAFADGAYRILRNVAEIEIVSTTISVLGYPIRTFETMDVLTPTNSPKDNDLSVTVESAQHPSGIFVGQIDTDHSGIKSGDVISGILSRIRADFQIEEP